MERRIPELEAQDRATRELLRQMEQQLAEIEKSRRWAYGGLLTAFVLLMTLLWAAIASLDPFAAITTTPR